MTQATADLSESEPVEQTTEEFLADVLSGYADDDDGSTPTTTPGLESEASAPPDDDAYREEDDPPAQPEVATAQPEDELRSKISALEANHRKYSDDMAGRVGMLEGFIKAQARTPAGQKVQVKVEDFGEFGEEYPEFAKAQVKVLNHMLGQLEVMGISPDFIDTVKKDANTAAERAAESKYATRESLRAQEELDEMHPGWKEMVGLPRADGTIPDTSYRKWLAAQPKDYADRVNNSSSSFVIGRSIDKFRAWEKSQNPKPKPVVPATPTRQQRLAAAVPARTSSTVPAPKRELTGREAMLKAFNSDD